MAADESDSSSADAYEMWSALHYAAHEGDLARVRAALDGGVDVNLRTRDSLSKAALAFAADGGYLEICRLLLDRGADVNIVDEYSCVCLCVCLILWF